MPIDPLYALLVIVVLVLPYLIWVVRADVLAMPPLPAVDDLAGRAMHWGVLLGGLLLAMAGIVLAAESRRGQARGSNLAAVLALTEVLDIRVEIDAPDPDPSTPSGPNRPSAAMFHSC